MITIRELEETIAVLEEKRPLLDEAVVDVSLNALRERLTQIKAQRPAREQAQLTVLVADISGFTSMSELRDAEEVRDTINAVWQRLDSVIVSWGGHVDKHVGDAVIALFGLPVPHNDDAAHAVQAALDMQMELTLMNEGVRQRAGQPTLSWQHPQAQLQMRIGIHTGPVVLGRVGSSQADTAVGDTVNIANELEKVAPVGGVLISQAVSEEVANTFELAARDPIQLNGKPLLTPVYVVQREKDRPFHISIRGIAGQETRIVGRNEELAQLQDTLQAVVDSGMAQVVTIVGQAGIGKSRVLYEFEQLLALQPERLGLFRGRVHQEVGQSPYALFRDLLSNYFDIHHRNSPAVAREKLVRGIVELMVEDAARARERAHFIGHLLGFDFSDSPYLQGILHDARRVREYAYQDMAALFMAVAEHNTAAVLFLEDLHWADEGSLDLLDYLLQSCQQIPMLTLVLARPTFFEKRPSWTMIEAINERTYQRIDLPPLNPIDSRHLVMDILRDVRQLPMRLVELVVAGANGNPFYIEEFITLLIEFDVVVIREHHWQVNMVNLPPMDAPPTLAELVQMRLEKLPPLARSVLQKAAVLGRVVWEPLLVHLVQHSDANVSPHEVHTVLQQLEQQGWLYRRQLSSLAAAQEYVFRHDSLHRAIYLIVEETEVLTDHGRAAIWLLEVGDANAHRQASVTAHHLAQSSQTAVAATWYAHAAKYAQDSFMPETAIQYYQEALTLLPRQTDFVSACINLNRGLGEMLRIQARFRRAATAFRAMQQAAHAVPDPDQEMRALRSQLVSLGLQGDWPGMYQASRQLLALSRTRRAMREAAFATAAQAWVQLGFNRVPDAARLAKEALSMSKASVSRREIGFSHAVLGNIARVVGRHVDARRLLKQALHDFRDEQDRLWEGMIQANLGHAAMGAGDLETAVAHYEEGLKIARDIGDYFLAVLSLRKLAQLAQEQAQYSTAEHHLRQALIFAEKSGNTLFIAQIESRLGRLYAEWSTQTNVALSMVEADTYWQQAYLWLDRAVSGAREDAHHLILSEALAGLAQLLLEDDEIDDALLLAKEALNAAEHAGKGIRTVTAQKVLAAAWRTAGEVLTYYPAEMQPVSVNGRSLAAADCFQHALTLLKESPLRTVMDQADVLLGWQELAKMRQDKARQNDLQTKLNALKEGAAA